MIGIAAHTETNQLGVNGRTASLGLLILFSISGALLVKRLQILPNGIRGISDNDAYLPYDRSPAPTSKT